jgi:hypothetical protein
MARRQPGKPRPPPTRRPHRRRLATLGIGQCSPVAEGLAPSSEPMTTQAPEAVGNLAAAGPQPRHPRALDPPCALATAVWLGRHRLSPVADVGPARPDASPSTCSRTSSRSRCLGHSGGNGGNGGNGGGGGQGGGQGGGSGDSGRVGEAGSVERLAPRPDWILLPDLPSLCGWPAAPTSAITRTDLTDLTTLSLQPSTCRVPVVGSRLGCAVRRLVLVPARGGGRAAAAGSVGVAEMRVRRASWTAGGRRSRAGW